MPRRYVVKPRLDGKRGDILFLNTLQLLPEPMRIVGKQLLTEVRKLYTGELVLHHESNKFVETPKNFWTISVQADAQSLRITVYGAPRMHHVVKSIKLIDDRPSYSNFIISHQGQLREAVDVIRKAKILHDQLVITPKT